MWGANWRDSIIITLALLFFNKIGTSPGLPPCPVLPLSVAPSNPLALTIVRCCCCCRCSPCCTSLPPSLRDASIDRAGSSCMLPLPPSLHEAGLLAACALAMLCNPIPLCPSLSLPHASGTIQTTSLCPSLCTCLLHSFRPCRPACLASRVTLSWTAACMQPLPPPGVCLPHSDGPPPTSKGEALLLPPPPPGTPAVAAACCCCCACCCSSVARVESASICSSRRRRKDRVDAVVSVSQSSVGESVEDGQQQQQVGGRAWPRRTYHEQPLYVLGLVDVVLGPAHLAPHRHREAVPID